jgi:hypothetical protein
LGAFRVVSELTRARGTHGGATRRTRRRLAMPALTVAAAAAALAAGSQAAHAFVEVGTIAGNDIFTDSTSTASSWYWDGLERRRVAAATAILNSGPRDVRGRSSVAQPHCRNRRHIERQMRQIRMNLRVCGRMPQRPIAGSLMFQPA